jgi:hypothetical protein
VEMAAFRKDCHNVWDLRMASMQAQKRPSSLPRLRILSVRSVSVLMISCRSTSSTIDRTRDDEREKGCMKREYYHYDDLFDTIDTDEGSRRPATTK